MNKTKIRARQLAKAIMVARQEIANGKLVTLEEFLKRMNRKKIPRICK